MKVNLRKVGAIVAGAAILASSAAFAGLMFGSTTLVDDNGAPVAKVVVGSMAQPSDGVAASLIAGKIVSETYKSQTLTAQVSGSASCSAGNATGTGTCAISNEKAQLSITVPGTTALGTWTGNNLIGDYLNRRLLDRKVNNESDSDTAYQFGSSDTSDSANPFTAGSAGGNLGSDEQFLYKVDGGAFSPFADRTVTDDSSGNSYVEHQAMWIDGDNHFSTDVKDTIGHLNFLAYSLKFDGPGGKTIGIPVCTQAVNLDYTACKKTGGNIDDGTETHRVKVAFLGEDWIISQMEAPAQSATTNESTESMIVNGGFIKLAKESVAGILNQGESLPVDNMKFQLDDLEAHGSATSAIISVLDANGNILKKDTIPPGETKDFNLGGKSYRFHVYKVAPGYTFGAKWADVAIFSKELTLTDGQKLDQDNAKNEAYQVALGWKNLDASTDQQAPDTLRTAIVYSDSIGDMSSSTTDDLSPGDYVTLVQDPAVWKLSYKGLDLAAADKATLKYQIKTTDLNIAQNHGPYTSCATGDPTKTFPTTCSTSRVRAACTVYAPYVDVKSGDGDTVFEADRDDQPGTMTHEEFIVALNTGGTYGAVGSAICDGGNDGEITTGNFIPAFVAATPGVYVDPEWGYSAGTIFMKESGTSSDYGVLDYLDRPSWVASPVKAGKGTEVRYEKIGDGDRGFAPPKGGALLIEGDGVWGDVSTGDTNQLGDILASTLFSGYTTAPPDFYFATAEKAGEGTSNSYVDYYVFGIQGVSTGTPGDATFKFESKGLFNAVEKTITSDSNQVLYGHAVENDGSGATPFYLGPSGPVATGLELVDEGYISERGSLFQTADKTNVAFTMAHKLGHAQWYMAAASANASSSAASIVTLGEGESTVVNGVTVKVLDITETVGACSAAGGASACTADMSGVSAVVMPNNAASVSVATPTDFTTYGNLVILDSDAAGVNTLISVGGDKVNSVTAGLLQGSATDWNANPKMVKEVVQGSKIVVAGKEASDTLSAAQDFISQVKKV